LEDGKFVDPNRRAAHHPSVPVGIGGFTGVVVGNVLEVPNRGVEAQSTTGRDIAETYPARGPKDPADARDRREFQLE
jgi:hypothetical protein